MDEPRWLDAAQQRDWRAYIEGSVRLADLIDRDLKSRHGLTSPEYEILVRLSEEPEHRLRMAELAEYTSQSRSRLSHTVARLEAKGLVSRFLCPSDKRGVNAQLTEEGFSTLDTAARDHVNVVRDYFVDLMSPEDLAVIGRVFRVITQRVGQADF